MSGGCSWGKLVVFEGNNFFQHNNWIVARKFLELQRFFSPGFSSNVFIHRISISQTKELRIIGEFFWRCVNDLVLLSRKFRGKIYTFEQNTLLWANVSGFLSKKSPFSGEVFQHCCRNRILVVQKKILMKDFFLKKTFFCEDFRVLAKYFWRLGKVFSSSLTKLHYSCRENNRVIKVIFDKIIFLKTLSVFEEKI